MPPVWTHRHAIDNAKVALQRAQFAAGFEIPHLQRFVMRSGNRTPSARTHRHACDRSRVETMQDR
jgi:hypothetical protein